MDRKQSKTKSEKVRVSLRIDKNIWELAEIMLPCSRNKWIENKLKEAVLCGNDLEALENELLKIANQRKELNSQEETIREKQIAIQKAYEINSKDQEKINKAMETLEITQKRKGAIPKSIINRVSKQHMIEYNVLLDHCKARNFTITNF